MAEGHARSALAKHFDGSIEGDSSTHLLLRGTSRALDCKR